MKDKREGCCPGIPRRKGFQGLAVSVAPKMFSKMKTEVTTGLNNSELFGDQSNANFSVVMGQEVTLAG